MLNLKYPLSFTSIPGNGVTSDPVAITIFFVLTTSLEPSSFKAVTSLVPVIFPWPFISVTCQKKKSNIQLHKHLNAELHIHDL